MTSLQIDDSIDLGDVNDCVREEHNVHLLHTLLLIVRNQFLVQILPQALKVRNFFVNALIVVIVSSDEEIDEDCIRSLICHATFLVVH